MQAGPDRHREPLQGELPVASPAPLVLGHRAHNRADAPPEARLLPVRERLRGVDVEEGLDARFRLLRVLPAGPLERE